MSDLILLSESQMRRIEPYFPLSHGVFNRILAELVAGGGKPDQLMIDATHLKAYRTAASLLKKGLYPDVLGAPRAA